jgi:hypothetical protein
MASHIGQCLLEDAEQGDLLVRVEWNVTGRKFQFTADIRVVAEFLGLPFDRRLKTQIENSRP